MRRSTLLMAAAREIPSGYTRLAYIEGMTSWGGAYINTGVTALLTHKLEAVFCGTTATMATRNGAGSGSGGNPFDITNYSGAQAYGGRFGGNGTGGVIPYVPYEIHAFGIYNGGFECDGRVYPLPQVSNVTAGQVVYLFTDVPAWGSVQMRLYSAKICDNGVPVRNFIPALRDADGKPGLWDTVTRQFFINSGTVEFTYAYA